MKTLNTSPNMPEIFLTAYTLEEKVALGVTIETLRQAGIHIIADPGLPEPTLVDIHILSNQHQSWKTNTMIFSTLPFELTKDIQAMHARQQHPDAYEIEQAQEFEQRAITLMRPWMNMPSRDELWVAARARALIVNGLKNEAARKIKEFGGNFDELLGTVADTTPAKQQSKFAKMARTSSRSDAGQ